MKKVKLSNMLLICGILLVILSLGISLFSVLDTQRSSDRARQIYAELRQLMPPITNAGADDRVNVVMPAMELSGESFCGILEIPGYHADLPICDRWERAKLSDYPCRFAGSIYDGSLIIGGSDRSGQLDFIRQISGGDTLYLTDMGGGRYRCTVADAYRIQDASAEYLMGLDADLVLFAKNTYSFDFTVVILNIE